VERDVVFPRMRRTSDLRDAGFDYAGPVRDKHAAERLIETVVDLFDLCRYHSVLVQAPGGKACAYKEMGKCPAPCDGSVPLSWYHGQMAEAFSFIAGPGRMQWKASTEAAMKAASGALNFEQAGRIKQRLSRAAMIEGEAFMHLGPLEEFAFLSLQPGQGKPYMEPWLIHPGMAEPVRPLQHLH
jgi:excinuclease UvrABC nuclease subunit